MFGLLVVIIGIWKRLAGSEFDLCDQVVAFVMQAAEFWGRGNEVEHVVVTSFSVTCKPFVFISFTIFIILLYTKSVLNYLLHDGYLHY